MEQSKGIVIIAIVALIVAMIAVWPHGENSTQTVTQQYPGNGLVVSGTAELKVEPDIAYITLSVLSEGKTAKEAQELNAVEAKKVVDALKNLGVQVETSGYTLYPKYEWNYEKQKNEDNGYSLNNELKITIKDVTTVGNVIDIAIENGANKVNYIQFSISDERLEGLRTTVVRNATQIATKKAQNLADSAGVKLDKITSISENSYSYPMYAKNYAYAEAASMDTRSATPIEPEKVEIQATVSISYDIEQ